jgi:hypothetical protein
MRRLALLLGAAAALAIPVGVAAEPPHDSVTGSGWVAYTDFPSPGVTTTEQQIVSARSGPNGEHPEGTMILHSEFGDQRADVTCMVVAGNVAIVGGEITSGFIYQGVRMKHLVFLIQDNGHGHDARDTASGYIFRDIPRPPGFEPCTPVLGAPIGNEVVRGNYVVNDAG